MRFSSVLATLLLLPPLHAQFVDVSGMLNTTIVVPGTEMGKALSFHDIDRNGWDDLSISTGMADPLFFFNVNGQFQPAPFNIPNLPAANINMLLWADFDNDGDADLLITKENAPIQLWRNDGNWQFTNIAAEAGLEQANFLYKGAAFCDYDHDGFLDLYVTKFYSNLTNPGLSFRGMLYRNNGDGTFTEVTEEAGVLIDTAPIFQPVFLDYDNDGWEDLFLVIDRVFHRNELFRNNGDGTFTNVSEESGMDILIDSMTGTVGDFDRNGYLDVYISANPYSGQHLMRNNGDGTFENVAPQMGVDLADVGWGGLWIDHDNDGWLDLFMGLASPVLANSTNQFFINDQGTDLIQATELVGLGEVTRTYVCAMGDIDRDGYPDFMTNNRFPHPAKLYKSTAGSNRWLTVTLQGVIANRDGVGTWVKIYTGGVVDKRISLFGSDLMAQSAQRLMFGLGQHTMIDSLVLEWNSGTRDVYYNVLVDQHLHLVEGAVQGPTSVAISHGSGLPVICPGGSLMLDAGPGFNTYLWNTGAQTQTISVDQPGTYQVTTTTQQGFMLISPPLEVSMAPTTQVTIQTQTPTCFGMQNGTISAILSTGPAQNITWNNGLSGQVLTGLGSGAYSFTGADHNGCPVFGGTFLPEPQPLIALLSTTDALCYDTPSGTVDVIPFGGTPPYFYDWGVDDPLAVLAGDHLLTVTDANGCEASVPYTIAAPPALLAEVTTTPAADDDGTASIAIQGGVPPYTWAWSTGEVNTATITGLAPGGHDVLVTDANLCEALFGFDIEQVIGMAEQHGMDLRLAPNPSNGTVWLLGQSCGAQMDATVTDAVGRVIRQGTWQCGEVMDLQGLPGGRYTMRLSSPLGTLALPLVLLAPGW